jgi:hypothetical protein
MDRYVAVARAAVSDANADDASAAIKVAHKRFSEITTSFNKSTEADYGLLYRVERSRYYVQRFRSTVAQMRILRVEGYQKYDQFVERRLGGSFDFINRLGRRYERAVSSLSLLDEYNLPSTEHGAKLEDRQLRALRQLLYLARRSRRFATGARTSRGNVSSENPAAPSLGGCYQGSSVR